jgi:hypothetical protein
MNPRPALFVLSLGAAIASGSGCESVGEASAEILDLIAGDRLSEPTDAHVHVVGELVDTGESPFAEVEGIVVAADRLSPKRGSPL